MDSFLTSTGLEVLVRLALGSFLVFEVARLVEVGSTMTSGFVSFTIIGSFLVFEIARLVEVCLTVGSLITSGVACLMIAGSVLTSELTCLCEDGFLVFDFVAIGLTFGTSVIVRFGAARLVINSADTSGIVRLVLALEVVRFGGARLAIAFVFILVFFFLC
ncbi:unnamed protein product [Adineta steineri]|uniref:Uncharacterized protein n=1 Tax=Adineta steineri TaxID=433720 RepID=A0A820PQP1_9BILA|nr:unnamed protein product [Adineta steineri]